MNSRIYPEGKTAFYTKRVAGVLKFFRRSDASEFYAIDGTNKRIIVPDVVRQIRTRFTVAQVNAGAGLLAALPGYKYRMIDAAAIAVGGAATAATGVDILAVLTTSRKLVAFKVAGLTQSTLLRAGTATNGVLLADGASYTANDVNTPISVLKDGSDVATATHIDIVFSYVIEVA